ncbi:uncharacterized protein LOC144388918 [Gasterosteus aculeatus]
MLRHFRAKHEAGQAAASIHGDRKVKIDEALVNMIVKDSQPFKVVEDQGFRALVSLLDPTYVLPSRQTLKSMVEAKYHEGKQKAKEKVQKATAVALTSDIWTYIHMDSYLAFTCHFVDEGDKLATVLLAVAKFGERHTASNIASVKRSIK